MSDGPQPTEENNPNRSPSLPSIPYGSEQTAQPDSRIEDYLDRVSAPLVEWVPYARRAELRAELRGHLEALAASYRELGSEPDLATEEALRQFGDPRELALRYADEWRRSVPGGSPPPIWPDLFVALGCFGLLTPLHSMLDMMTRSAGHPVAAWITLAITLQLTAGLATGLVAPSRPVRGTLYALAILGLTTLGQVLALHYRSDTGGGRWLQGVWDSGRIVVQGLMASLFMALLGCGGAALGSRLRALLMRKPARWVVR